MALQNKLKAFVRFDGSGRVIPSSLILQKSKPKVGNWKEINATQCCNDTPTTTTTSTSNTTTTTTTYSGTYYNAGLASNGSTAVCNNSGPYNLPLIVDPNACSNGSITLVSGTYADYGIPNGSTIYINLNNGNVIQVQTYGSSTMSFGCTSCSGTTSTTTTAAPLTTYRIGITPYGSDSESCSNVGDLNGGTTLYAHSTEWVNGVQLYYDEYNNFPYTGTGWYPAMVGWPSGFARAMYIQNGVIQSSSPC